MQPGLPYHVQNVCPYVGSKGMGLATFRPKQFFWALLNMQHVHTKHYMTAGLPYSLPVVSCKYLFFLCMAKLHRFCVPQCYILIFWAPQNLRHVHTRISNKVKFCYTAEVCLSCNLQRVKALLYCARPKIVPFEELVGIMTSMLTKTIWCPRCFLLHQMMSQIHHIVMFVVSFSS